MREYDELLTLGGLCWTSITPNNVAFYTQTFPVSPPLSIFSLAKILYVDFELEHKYPIKTPTPSPPPLFHLIAKLIPNPQTPNPLTHILAQIFPRNIHEFLLSSWNSL
jgi:hypothetical protein